MSRMVEATDLLLPINEWFGPVIQGEGPFAGRVSSFIRTGGCNLSCTRCDTPATWDTEHYDLAVTCPPRPISEPLADLRTWGAPITVVTGGEPLLHQRRAAFTELLARLPGDIHVETNGTITPAGEWVPWVKHWSVSPKLGGLASPLDPEARRIRAATLAHFAEMADRGYSVALKIVCGTGGQVHQAASFAALHGFPLRSVWVMPQGRTHDEVSATSRMIGPWAPILGVNFSPRLHLQMGVR